MCTFYSNYFAGKSFFQKRHHLSDANLYIYGSANDEKCQQIYVVKLVDECLLLPAGKYILNHFARYFCCSGNLSNILLICFCYVTGDCVLLVIDQL